MTGLTAEKHDSFLQPSSDGTAIVEFSGKELVKRRAGRLVVPLRRHPRHLRGPRLHRLGPDQPAFILESPNGATLVIPTAFLSWTGEALDKKTPLLRSMEALSTQALRILRLFGNTRGQEGLHHRRPRAGILPDRQELLLRRGPTCINAGRTLFGAKPPKGQELEDQYFGAIPERVLACMADCEAELFKLGVPGQDPAQRGGPEPVRDRADLRGLQPRHRPPDC